MHTNLLNEPFDHLPPEAESTFEGHRAFGYDLATALADIVDNSLTARAQNVWLDCEWNGSDSTITITDDGEGMSERELLTAMRLSSRNPRDERSANDLGRFGLGLKTASLSQCRRFTVRTRRMRSEAATRCWDLPAVLKEAHAHLLHQSGNPSEAAKKPECWEDFRGRPIELNATWERELADTPFLAPSTDAELLAAEWEKLRHQFVNDDRTIEGLEAYTGKTWVRTRRRDAVSSYAVLTWEQLHMQPGLGPKKVRDLVQMFAAALT